MSTREFYVSAEDVARHLQSKIGDMPFEEVEDVAIALFNVKTRIVTDKEDARTFFEFSKVMSMKANSLFDQFSGEMHPFFSLPDNSAWYVDFEEGMDILNRALDVAAPEFLSEVVADKYNVDAIPAPVEGHVLVRQHATTVGVGDEVASHFFNEAKRILGVAEPAPKKAAGMGM